MRVSAPPTPSTSCGPWTRAAAWGCETPLMRCWVGPGNRPAVSRVEAIKAILAEGSITLPELLDQTRGVARDEIVEVLVGDAYERLDAAAQQVMQALAVYGAPVSAVGVDFLLDPGDLTTNAAPILTRLVNRELVRPRRRPVLPAPRGPGVRPEPGPRRPPRRHPGRVTH